MPHTVPEQLQKLRQNTVSMLHTGHNDACLPRRGRSFVSPPTTPEQMYSFQLPLPKKPCKRHFSLYLEASDANITSPAATRDMDRPKSRPNASMRVWQPRKPLAHLWHKAARRHFAIIRRRRVPIARRQSQSRRNLIRWMVGCGSLHPNAVKRSRRGVNDLLPA